MRHTVTEGFRLSPQQIRAWTQAQYSDTAFRSVGVVRIRGALEAARFRSALAAVVEQHEILRTSFPRLPGMGLPLQVIDAPSAILLRERDFSGVTDRDATVEALFEAECRHEAPADAAALGALLVRFADDDHALFLRLPALCADRMTLEGLVRDLALHYSGQLDQAEPIQYADVSEWLHTLLESEETAAGRFYWQEQDYTPLSSLQLPYAHRTGAHFEPQSITASLDRPVADALARTAREATISTAALLLTCWQVLLYRLSGQGRVIVAVEMDGRSEEELQGAAGLYARYVPVFAHLEAHTRMADAAQRVNEALDEAGRWQDYFSWNHVSGGPETAQEEVFYPYTFAFEPRAPQPHGIDGLVFQIAQRYTCFERADVHLAVAPGADGSLALTFRYDPAVLSAKAAAVLAGQYRTLAENAARQPAATIGAIEIVSAHERAQLLEAFTASAATAWEPGCLHALFEAQVERTPDHTALLFEGEPTSYRGLNRHANQLAHYLRQCGVGLETPVGILMDRSVAQVVGVLAVLKAGGAFVPLDPDYPRQRIAYLIQDAGLRVLLTQQAFLEHLPPLTAAVIVPEEEQDAIAQEPEENPTSRGDPENLAYILYTSGSTGRPKGCQISHRSVCHYLNWAHAYYFGNAPFGNFSFYTSLAFDFTLTSLFSTLLRGKTLHVYPQAGEVLAILAHSFHPETPIDAVKITPSHVALLEHCAVTATNVRRVILGGEALTRRHLDALASIDGAFEIYNEYGPTEATVGCIVKRVTPDDHAVLIGTPIAGAPAYVVRPSGALAAIGEPGEIWVAGAGVARGYRQRPGATAEKFVPDPFSATPGARLYRTGDLGRWTPDGDMEFLGRIDHQVKVRGFRIEPGEIEAALAGHPAIEQALVTAREDQPGDQRLVAYLIAVGVAAPRPAELRQYLADRLPEYMVPTAYVFLDHFPLTPNGKIDRQGLPAPDQGTRALESRYEAPRNIVELQLAEIWESVLEVHPIGRTNDFFELGGHSLRAIQLIGRIQDRFGTNLPLSILFQCPTVELLARTLRDGADAGVWKTLVGVRMHGERPPFFMVPGAGGNVVYLHHLARHLGPEQPFYALQQVGLDGQTPPHRTVEEIAAHNTAEIRTVQAHGPYYLGGHSYGGKIAFEMAQQLQRAGEAVALVAIFDTLAPYPTVVDEGRDGETRALVEIARVVEEFKRGEAGSLHERLPHLPYEEQLVVLKELLEQEYFLPPHSDLTHVRGFVEVFRVNNETSYYPPDWQPTRIVVFRSRELPEPGTPTNAPEALLIDPVGGWNAFASEPVDVYSIPGNHITMMAEPHVQILAERLASCLADTRKRYAKQ